MSCLYLMVNVIRIREEKLTVTLFCSFFRSIGGTSLLVSYLLSHNLPRGFLPELVHTTCDDSDTFRRVRQLMFLVTLKTNDNQEFRTLSWKKNQISGLMMICCIPRRYKFSNRQRALYICMSKCSLVYLHKKKWFYKGEQYFLTLFPFCV